MKNILVIEDNYEVRESIAELLEVSDYRVSTAENGVVGVQKAIQEPPDLILCDILMPELDGFGVLNILEQKPQTAAIPFIFLTAKTESRDFRKGMRLGADDYITKPFEAVELLEAVAMRLKKNDRLRNNFWISSASSTFFDEQKVKKEMKYFAAENRVRKFREREVIYREYEYPHTLHLVLSGSIKVVKSNAMAKEFIVDICRPGSFFGYNELIHDKPYAASAIAMEDVEISYIPKEEFLNLLATNRHFSAMFIKMVTGKLLHKEEQVLMLAYSSHRKRVAEALLYLSEVRHPQQENEISILRADLAEMIGSAKETISRTLAEFREEGLIETRNGMILLKNADKMRQIPD
jgi:CheY-like chemotaxis protein/CRP-like cAMP-binding protein